MTEQQRPQDPVPPGYQPAAGAQHTPGEAFQAYQAYPAGYSAPPPYPPAYPGYYPGYAPPQGIAPPNHLAWAIVSIFLFWPVGIAAVVKSTQVDRYWAMGQPAMAEDASRTAKTLCVVCTVLAGVLIVLWFTLVLVFFSGFSDTIGPPPR